jgi:peroxiredoxin
MSLVKRKIFGGVVWPVILAGLILLSGGLFVSAYAATSTEGKKGFLKLGDLAPDFRLTDVVSGREVTLADYKDDSALLIAVICRHCPFVQHIKTGLAQLGRDYEGKGLAIVAISANDPAGYPEDAPEKLKEMAIQEGFTFPLLFDGTQAVAKAYTAIATPDFFLFNKDRKLVYRGQFDDSRPKSGLPVTGKDIRSAIDATLKGRSVPEDQRPSVGCSIKWKPGNAPQSR